MPGCARPTCARTAAFGLGYDVVHCVAWLVPLDSGSSDLVPLCARHADRLTLPHGWSGHDDRRGQPALWLAASDTADVAAGERTHDTSPPAAGTGVGGESPATATAIELPLWDGERHDPAAHLAEDLYGDPGFGDRTPDDEPAATPAGPLLARAFRAAGLG